MDALLDFLLAPGYFAAGSHAYLWIAVAWLALVEGVVRLVSPGAYAVLRFPAIVLHEAAHGFMAGCMGAKVTQAEVTPYEHKPGEWIAGYVAWEGAQGSFAPLLIATAPLAGLPAAFLLAGMMLSQPHSLLAGMAWLALCYQLVDCAAMFSWTDFKAAGAGGWLPLLALPFVLLAGASALALALLPA